MRNQRLPPNDLSDCSTVSTSHFANSVNFRNFQVILGQLQEMANLKWRRNKFKRAISAFSFEIPAAFQSVQFSRITLCRFWRFQEGWCSAEKQLAGRSENKNLASFPKNSHETYFFFVQIESYFVQYLTSAVYISGSFEDSKPHNIMSLSRVKIEVFFEENCERCFPKTNKVGHVWHSPRPCWISQ